MGACGHLFLQLPTLVSRIPRAAMASELDSDRLHRIVRRGHLTYCSAAHLPAALFANGWFHSVPGYRMVRCSMPSRVAYRLLHTVEASSFPYDKVNDP